MPETVKQILDRLQPDAYVDRYGKVITDTSDFMRINSGDIIRLQDQHYLVYRDEQERSFGIEDPKYWVKRCRHLESGKRCILKLVFYEEFFYRMGELKIPCYRSPRKEARILDLVYGDHRFMQGRSTEDEKGNNVRILDIIRGKRLDNWVYKLDMDHRTYFKNCLPGILKKFIKACDAIQYLHENGEKHGDIRRDHLWVPSGSDDYVWIDFDYTFTFNENPFGMDVFGLGGLLLYLTGMGFYSFQDIQAMYAKKKQMPDLEQGDFLLVFKNRLANLRKIFPYIPEDLNWILMHFSGSANVYYDTVEEFLSDLKPCVSSMG